MPQNFWKPPCDLNTIYILTTAESRVKVRLVKYITLRLLVLIGFYTPPLKKCGFYVIPSVQKFVLSVCPSICKSVCHHFVAALYLEHFLTDFLQTLHNSWYWGGVVLDCRWVNFVKSAQSYCPLFMSKNGFHALSRSFFGRLSSNFPYEFISSRSGFGW